MSNRTMSDNEINELIFKTNVVLSGTLEQVSTLTQENKELKQENDTNAKIRAEKLDTLTKGNDDLWRQLAGIEADIAGRIKADKTSMWTRERKFDVLRQLAKEADENQQKDDSEPRNTTAAQPVEVSQVTQACLVLAEATGTVFKYRRRKLAFVERAGELARNCTSLKDKGALLKFYDYLFEQQEGSPSRSLLKIELEGFLRRIGAKVPAGAKANQLLPFIKTLCK